MGTHADFYIYREDADDAWEWLGSVNTDGYSNGQGTTTGVPVHLLRSRKIKDFKTRVHNFLKKRLKQDGEDHVCFPQEGWPRPYASSALTDWTYVFIKDNKKVWASSYGDPYINPLDPPPEGPVFPMMNKKDEEK